MKKIELIELVADALKGGSATDMESEFHDKVIQRYLELAFNGIIYQVWLNCRSFSDYSQMDGWTRDYSLNLEGVEAGTSTFSGILRLPYPPIQLPDNGGIRELKSVTDETVFFAFVEATSDPIFNELEVSTLDDVPTMKLSVNNLGGLSSHILKLQDIPISIYQESTANTFTLKMIVPLERIDLYDDVAMPEGITLEGIDYARVLVSRTIDLLKGKLPADLNNDMRPERSNP